MKNSTVQLTFKVDTGTAEQVRKLAIQNHITTAEQIRRFVDKGLQVGGYTQEIDFIAGIIRQELMAIYQLDDIRKVAEQQTERLIKMLMKTGKISAGSFFLLVKIMLNMLNEGSGEEFAMLVETAGQMGIECMQLKNSEINSILNDGEYLCKKADENL